MKTRESMVDAESARVATDKLMADLKVLADDVKQLMVATSSQGELRVAQMQSKARESLQTARARVAELKAGALVKTRAAGRASDEYVHANPWQVMAACTVGGFVLGALLARGAAAGS